MISKINHLLPLISLNCYLESSWKCIRRIIFRDILKNQTTPLESAVPFGLGFYNLIVRPIIKMIDRELKFQQNIDHTQMLKNAAKKALIFWKSLEKKLPNEVEKVITDIIEDRKWQEIDEFDRKIYDNLGNRLTRNCEENIIINNLKILKYPNMVYLLSNALSHEITDTLIQRENSKDESNKQIRKNRAFNLIKRICIIHNISKNLINDKSYVTSITKNKDIDYIIEEMTLIELKINEDIKKEKEIVEVESQTILDQQILRIKKELKNKEFKVGTLIKNTKLSDKQKELRTILSGMNSNQSKLLDLAYELVEYNTNMINKKIQSED